MTEDEIFMMIERDSMEKRRRTRQVLLEHGRPDLAEELDRNLREVDNGIAGAKATWHSISAAQRRALTILADGYELRRASYSRTKYDGYCAARKRDALGYTCPIGTVRALCARELAHVNGGALDPEKVIVVTERGKFVVKHGQQTPGA
jgi:hypothetical protein